jgi:hypothetical protein
MISMITFVNDSLTAADSYFSRTFANGKFVNGKQLGKKDRFAFSAYYSIAFSECPMRCYQ